VVQLRQAGRGQNHVGGELVLAEDPALPAADLGGGDQDRHRRSGPQRREVDELVQELAQRIDGERVELVGREQVGRQAKGEGADAATLQR